MNRDEDVLFLALSSHGWQDATIDVSNEGMTPQTLSAATLADLLAESGIRWKVIVVSACFSGTFVKPLADDHTIVITAASRNRASFGCSDTRHLTYFGEAFFRDALPGAAQLRDAFETARQEIRRREKGRGHARLAAAGILRAVDGREAAGIELEKRASAAGRCNNAGPRRGRAGANVDSRCYAATSLADARPVEIAGHRKAGEQVLRLIEVRPLLLANGV